DGRPTVRDDLHDAVDVSLCRFPEMHSWFAFSRRLVVRRCPPTPPDLPGAAGLPGSLVGGAPPHAAETGSQLDVAAVPVAVLFEQRADGRVLAIHVGADARKPLLARDALGGSKNVAAHATSARSRGHRHPVQ